MGMAFVLFLFCFFGKSISKTLQNWNGKLCSNFSDLGYRIVFLFAASADQSAGLPAVTAG